MGSDRPGMILFSPTTRFVLFSWNTHYLEEGGNNLVRHLSPLVFFSLEAGDTHTHREALLTHMQTSPPPRPFGWNLTSLNGMCLVPQGLGGWRNI